MSSSKMVKYEFHHEPHLMKKTLKTKGTLINSCYVMKRRTKVIKEK